MSENDYIAEYVKEKFPRILGADFYVWKCCRMARELARAIGETFNVFGKTVPEEREEAADDSAESAGSDKSN